MICVATKKLLNGAHCASALQELRLDNNGLGIKGGTMLAQSLMKLVDNAKEAGTPLKLKVRLAHFQGISVISVVFLILEPLWRGISRHIVISPCM